MTIRQVHRPDLERRALEAWRSRYSLVNRLLRLKARHPQRALALARHAERWGWGGLVDLVLSYQPAICPTCDGWGRIGDDIPCWSCGGEGRI